MKPFRFAAALEDTPHGGVFAAMTGAGRPDL
jgi:hypothetical protein